MAHIGPASKLPPGILAAQIVCMQTFLCLVWLIGCINLWLYSTMPVCCVVLLDPFRITGQSLFEGHLKESSHHIPENVQPSETRADFVTIVELAHKFQSDYL